MAQSPFSGVNSRLKSAPIAVVNTSDLVTPLGTETLTNMVEYASWNVDRSRAGGQVLTASAPADAQGNISPRKLRGGVVNPKITIEGIYNGDQAAGASSDARFTIGAFLVLNLIFHQYSLWGYYNVVAEVVSSSAGTKIGPDPATVRVELEVDGLLPAPSTS